MSTVAVVALLGHPAWAAPLAAGFEEEGVPLVVESAEGDALELARAAARRSLLGLGIGGDLDRLALVLAASSARAYLESPPADARSLGHAAARIAARRPLRYPL